MVRFFTFLLHQAKHCKDVVASDCNEVGEVAAGILANSDKQRVSDEGSNVI